MIKNFFEIDFEKIYPAPTPQAVAEAYFNRLYRKLHVDNFSLLITFYGRHRVGKSVGAVSFAYILDPTFEENLETRVVYTGKDIVNAFNEIKKKKIKGGAVVIDEAGSTEISNQRWYEESAKLVNAELQAIGYLNPFIAFVTQSFSFINTTARKLSQGVFEVNRNTNQYSNIKPFWIDNNPWVSSTYRKYPIFCERRNNVVSNVFKINNIKIGLPPEDVFKRYRHHSEAFKDNLLKSSIEELETMDLLKQQKSVFVTGIDAIVTEVLTNIDNYTTTSHLGTTVKDEVIKHKHELTWRDAKLVKALVEQKMKKQHNTHTQG